MIDAGPVQQCAEQQPRRTGADDRNLNSHDSFLGAVPR